MLERLRRWAKAKDMILGAAILVCLTICLLNGFPELPCTKPGLGGELSAAMLRSFLWENMFAVAFFFLAAVFGTTAVGMGLMLRRGGPENRDFVEGCLYLGIFILLSGVWMLTDSSFLSLYISNWNAISFISFLSFMLMPLVSLRFFDYIIPGLQRLRAADWLLSINLGAFLVLCMCKANGWLMVMLLGVHHLLVIYIIVYVWCHQRRDGLKSGKLLLASSGLLLFFLFSLTALAVFLLGYVRLYPVIYGIGLIFLVVSVFHRLVERMLRLFRDQMEMDRFKEMAYTDGLCQIGNRSAFQLKQQSTIHGPGVCYVVFDLNGLKWTNDHLGHGVGDYLIHTAARMIQNAFLSIGACYRVGGDEFAVICPEMTERGVQEVLEKLEQAVDQRNRRQEPALSLSWGYALWETPADTAEVLFDRADKNMYRQKQARNAARKT